MFIVDISIIFGVFVIDRVVKIARRRSGLRKEMPPMLMMKIRGKGLIMEIEGYLRPDIDHFPVMKCWLRRKKRGGKCEDLSFARTIVPSLSWSLRWLGEVGLDGELKSRMRRNKDEVGDDACLSTSGMSLEVSSWMTLGSVSCSTWPHEQNQFLRALSAICADAGVCQQPPRSDIGVVWHHTPNLTCAWTTDPWVMAVAIPSLDEIVDGEIYIGK